jgi:hypothetical protein
MLSRPAQLLRIEDAFLLAAAILVYAHFHFSWVLFGVLFLVPDLFMLGYLVNPRIGAAIYNFAHTLSIPLVVAAIGWMQQRPLLLAIAVIWLSHIAFDRLLGYGLKYPAHFGDTHLQHLG